MENLLKFIIEAYLPLVPVLLIIGYIMKKSEKVKDTSIPWALCLTGIVLASLITLATADLSTWQNAVGEITQGIIQGILVTGGAVLASQLYIQKRKAEEEKALAESKEEENVNV